MICTSLNRLNIDVSDNATKTEEGSENNERMWWHQILNAPH